MTEERHPCPRCGEAILPSATVCPHCRNDVYFDVVLTAPVSDPRAAYHGARSLEDLEGQPLAFLDLKNGLENAPGVLIPLLTYSVAASVAKRLEYHGLAAEVAPHGEVADPVALEGGGGFRMASVSAVGFIRGRPGTTFAIVAAAVLTVALVGVDRKSGTDTPDHGPADMQKLALIAEHATVHLRCENQLGAGFFVDEDLVVTNAHVLCEGDRQVDVTFSDGRTRRGRVVQRDDWLDAALVRVPGFTSEPLTMADSTHVERGEQIFLMGSPHGMDFSFSQGMVSHPNRNIMGLTYIQIDAGVNPGNSGGPLLDADGRAVGIVSMMVGASDNIGLALPINYLVNGPQPILAATDLEIDQTTWQARISEAVEDDQQEVARARSEIGQAGLFKAFQLQYRPYNLVATIGRWSADAPLDESFTFELSRNDSPLCIGAGISREWRPVGSSTADLVPGRYLIWLKRHGLLREMYTTHVVVDTFDCPRTTTFVGATLTLHGAASDASEVRVQPGSNIPGDPRFQQ